MDKKRIIIGISALAIISLASVGCAASAGDEDTTGDSAGMIGDSAHQIAAGEDPTIDDGQLIGGSPASCGYSWDAERGGWVRPWEAGSFIPAAEKPEWDAYIPDDADDPAPAPKQDQDPSEALDIGMAPIHDVSIAFAESFPVQVMVHVEGGLASSCTTVHEVKTERAGNTIRVAITTATPKDLMCATVYESFEENINLGSDFEPGQTYTVDVNGHTVTFTME